MASLRGYSIDASVDDLRWVDPRLRFLRSRRRRHFVTAPCRGTCPGRRIRSGALPESGVTLHAGNRATFVNDERVFDALAEDVAWAKSSIHILSYIWKKGTASDLVAAITERARSGVACRIIVDAFGSLSFEEDGVGPALRDAGCVVREFRPPALADTPKQLC